MDDGDRQRCDSGRANATFKSDKAYRTLNEERLSGRQRNALGPCSL
jgi:hypothetical protein